MNTLLWIILATLINGLVALVGVFSLWVKEKLLRKILLLLVAFSAGALLSGALFHMMPHSLEHLEAKTSFAYLMIGFALFFLIEKFLYWHHCHEGKCDVHPVSYLILFGDGIHNLIDGFIIGVSFLVSIPFGIITTLVIIGHEIPQELGDFGVLVYSGFSKMKALIYNFLSQLSAILGGILGYFLSSSLEQIIPFIIPFAAGGFIYISASDLIPELHKEPDIKKSLLYFLFFVIGVIFVWLIKSLLEH